MQDFHPNGHLFLPDASPFRNSKFNNNADQAERFVRGVKEGEEDQVGKGHIKMVAVAMEEKVE